MTSNVRLALVTGASDGIGLEIAREIGMAGHRVVLGARNAQRGEAAANALRGEDIDARYMHLDLEDSSTFAAAAAAINAREGSLDILVASAGLTSLGDLSLGVADVDALRRNLETNFFGTLALTQAMLPLLRRSGSGRIVNVSNGLGSMALNMLTIQLAAKLKDSGIKVNAANPGFTARDLNGHQNQQTVQEGALAAVGLALLADDGPTGGFLSAKGVIPW